MLATEGRGKAAARTGVGLHILVLTDRDWTHPQAGGTGTNLFGQVTRWIEWGHRVTVIACGYPGAVPHERVDGLTVHRIGGRVTVFPRAIIKQWRGLVPDADVVLEIVNGISFLTPVWLRTPRVVLVHHIHRDHYVAELGAKGRIAALALETAPLRRLYRDARFLTVSRSSAEEIAELGIARDQIAVNYNGVESELFGRGPKATEPTLLYLGRLKRYKRLEWLLDVVEGVPGAVLDVAGDGDHRQEFEQDIARRGLGDRVRLHGHVDEATKLRLLQRAWVHVTASSAEGWSLTVMEAAACGTPTVATAAGGMRESVQHGRTGLLADDAPGLAAATRRLVEDDELRERFGASALARARELSWDRCAAATLDALDSERERASAHVEGPGTQAFAAGVVTANVLALGCAMLIARLFGAADFGAVAALLSAFLIVSVPGAALQVGVARAVAGAGGDPGHWLAGWLRGLAAAAAGTALVSLLLRDAIAGVIGVDSGWAAAVAAPAGCLWLFLSVQRGALQGLGRGRAARLSLAGEAVLRVLLGLLLVGVGLGVAGALLSLLLALLLVASVLGGVLGRALPRTGAPAPAPRLKAVLGRSLLPLLVLTLAALVQNIDVIVAQHRLDGDAAGSYAAAAVAAKAIVWLGVGIGLYLLAGAVGRVRRSPVVDLLPAVAALATCLILVYVLLGDPLLALLYGSALDGGGHALPWLGMAMGLATAGYLGVQYLLVHGRAGYVWLLALVAVVEPLALQLGQPHSTGVARTLVAVQLGLVAGLGLMLTRTRRARGARGAVPLTAAPETGA